VEIRSRIEDKRIDAENFLIEMTYREYLDLAREIIQNNPLQRKRVRSANTVYSLLKSDLKKGCMLPSIVLALFDETLAGERTISDEDISSYIYQNRTKLIILDGLQRTYTMLDVERELRDDDPAQLSNFYDYKLRIELYLGINKFGVLYRMLTLNTGQTPMSLRHQIEILYKDYLDTGLDGIRLVPEKENEVYNQLGIYRFKDTIDGFNSYLEREPYPLEKFDILNNINGLEKLSEENNDKDVFKEFIVLYDSFVKKINELTDGYILSDEVINDIELEGTPFGKTSFKIFNKSQPITGFGAAIGKLKDFEKIQNLEECLIMIEEIQSLSNPEGWIIDIVKCIDKIKTSAKKIGSSQRVFFYWFFRELFNNDSDSFLDLEEALKNGYNKYRSQME
jgi:hypothetical protein